MNGAHDCGASVLTPTRALSAAHCYRRNTPPSIYSIKAGSTFRLDQGDTNGQIRTLTHFILHPDYTGTPSTRSDVAVLSWQRPLVFGRNVRPVVLARPGYVVPYGRLGVTSGWGLTAPGQLPLRLQVVAQPFVSNVNCNRAYPGLITNVMVCAGWPQGGRGSCTGDSGGPLVDTTSATRYTQVGIVSWGAGCAQPNRPGVYARVSQFNAWIRRHM